MADHYGSVSRGDQFFSARLHSFDWINATPDDKRGALVQAAELIDQFIYLGEKYAVAILGDDATEEEKRVADLSQPLEFPRGTVSQVPEDIERAAYLIAKALLASKAKVNARARISGKDYTPLSIAKQMGHAAIVTLLTDYGAED